MFCRSSASRTSGCDVRLIRSLIWSPAIYQDLGTMWGMILGRVYSLTSWFQIQIHLSSSSFSEQCSTRFCLYLVGPSYPLLALFALSFPVLYNLNSRSSLVANTGTSALSGSQYSRDIINSPITRLKGGAGSDRNRGRSNGGVHISQERTIVVDDGIHMSEVSISFFFGPYLMFRTQLRHIG